MKIGGNLFEFMIKFSLGRYLLLNYPKVFSMGYISKDGVPEKQMNYKFKMTFYAKGWDESQGTFSANPDRTLTAEVTGSNPYQGSCASLLLSAITILKEREKMPAKGGVLTPGAAFYNTDFIKNLHNHKNGFKFSILHKSSMITNRR